MRGVQYASRNHGERGRRGESSAVRPLHAEEVFSLPDLPARLLAGHAPAKDDGGAEGDGVWKPLNSVVHLT